MTKRGARRQRRSSPRRPPVRPRPPSAQSDPTESAPAGAAPESTESKEPKPPQESKPPRESKPPQPTLPPWLHEVARRWTTFVGSVAGGILTWIVGTLAGVHPLPGTVPLFNLVHEQPLPVLLAGVLVFLVTVAAWLVTHQPKARPAEPRPEARPAEPQPEAHPARPPPRWRWYQVRPVQPWLLAAITAVATLSTSTSVALAAVVLVRPEWCPQALCPQVPGPHDQYLAADFNAFESETYVVQGDLASYTLANLPSATRGTSVPAQRVLASGQSADSEAGYRLSLKVTSLQRGQLGMLITGVTLAVLEARPPPTPLRVVLVGAPLQYRVNPYRAVYQGQVRGELITAPYAGPQSLGYVQLQPGESDELSVQIVSRQLVDLKFRISVGYRPVAESGYRTLELPYVFEAVFSDQLDWQQYRFTGGGLVPG